MVCTKEFVALKEELLLAVDAKLAGRELTNFDKLSLGVFVVGKAFHECRNNGQFLSRYETARLLGMLGRLVEAIAEDICEDPKEEPDNACNCVECKTKRTLRRLVAAAAAEKG